jgi:hypothetical protein
MLLTIMENIQRDPENIKAIGLFSIIFIAISMYVIWNKIHG